MSIKSDTNIDTSTKLNDKFELNLHPPINKLIDAIINFITHYKWEFITVVYQDPNRVEDLIRFSYITKVKDYKLRFQFKLLSKNADEWIDLISEIKKSGSVHLIIDIRAKLINKFIAKVNHFSRKITQ